MSLHCERLGWVRRPVRPKAASQGDLGLPELGVANPSPNPEALGDTDLDAPALELEVRTDDDWVIDCTPVQCSPSRDAVAAVIGAGWADTTRVPPWTPVVEERPVRTEG